MKRILLVAVGIAAVAGLIFAYVQMSKERAAEAAREKPVASESTVNRSASGAVTVRIDAETQQRLALEIGTLAAAQLRPEIKGYGRVLDPTPLSLLAADVIATGATADASQREWDRLKVLSVGQNASERALESAEATAQRDHALAESARQRLLAAWGKTIAERPDLQGLIQSLATGERALARIDLLAGERLRSKPEGARLSPWSDENNPVEAEFVSSMPNVDARTQGQGFLFLVKSNASRFVPGAAVVGYLRIGGEARSGVVIPRGAVVRFNGQPWVYLQTGEQTFSRREISEERPWADGWFMAGGLKPGDRVVTRGAQMLLSEERKDQIRMGD